MNRTLARAPALVAFILGVLAIVASDACSRQVGDPAYDRRVASSSSSLLGNEPVVWANVVNANANGSTLSKTGGQPQMEDAGGTSKQAVVSGDASVELTIAETAGYKWLGLAHTSGLVTGADIDFAIRLQSGRADIYEKGVWKADNVGATGDVMRVSIESGVVKYYKNGALLYTSAAAPRYPLLADASLIDSNASVSNVQIAGAAGYNVDWAAVVNATASGSALQKTGGQPATEDGGGTSLEDVASGDAWLQLTMSEASPYRWLGFGHSHTWTVGAGTDFGFRLQSGRADIYEGGSWKADNTAVAGDVLKVAITGGVASYYKNGALLYTSSRRPVYPLVADASFIDPGGTVQDVIVSRPPAAFWGNLVNASATGSTIQKTAGQPQMEDAGGTSTAEIDSGDGTLAFTMSEANTFRWAGFGHSHTWTTAGNLDYEFRLQSGRADVYERGAWVADNTAVQGDTLSIVVSRGVVSYRKNGSVIHTSSRSPTYPLVAEASLIDSNATIAGASLTLAGGGGIDGGTDAGSEAGSPGTTGHHFCGWLTGIGNDAATDPWFDDFAANAGSFDAVHPTWWSVNDGSGGNCCTGGGIFCEGFGNPASTHAGCPSTQVTANTTYSGKRTKLIPMVAGTTRGQVALVRSMLANSTTMNQWITTLVGHAQTWRYDGYDIDFEHLNDDGSHPEVRDQLTTFIANLAAQLHSLGKTVSLAVDGPTSAAGEASSQWNLAALANAADQLHVMGYDYHWMGASHPGPVDPLDWAKAAIAYAQTINGGRTIQKFIWGLPNYGIEGPDGQPVIGEPQQGLKTWLANHPGYATTSTEMNTCPFNVDTHYGAGRSPNAYSGTNHAYFDDVASLEEKVIAAKQGGLGGITYWVIGDEPDQPAGPTFFQMVRTHFPQQ